ncbi:MAG: lipopolysaccharide transport periplasmic protein LptA [Pseudomonadota bacterium]
MSHQKINTLTAIALALLAPLCFAEQADREQPVQLQADQVVVDDVKKTSTFTGSVQLSQGTLRILGDKIVVVQDPQGFKQITISGNSASFRQKRDGVNEYVEGSGGRIEYNTNNERIDLYSNARITRNQDEIRGEHITYSAKTGIFQADDNSKKSGKAAPQRVQAILFPKSDKTVNAPAPDVSGKQP